MSEPSASEGAKPPERIYLQYYGDEEPSEGPAMEVSWCAEKIYEHDVEYMRLERIAEYAEKRAQHYAAKLGAAEAELACADYAARADTYRRLAREIRDGAHREE